MLQPRAPAPQVRLLVEAFLRGLFSSHWSKCIIFFDLIKIPLWRSGERAGLTSRQPRFESVTPQGCLILFFKKKFKKIQKINFLKEKLRLKNN
jgi:hypothetical protein